LSAAWAEVDLRRARIVLALTVPTVLVLFVLANEGDYQARRTGSPRAARARGGPRISRWLAAWA
jgi:hypothetical protein